jgi:hypothetical protein
VLTLFANRYRDAVDALAVAVAPSRFDVRGDAAGVKGASSAWRL